MADIDFTIYDIDPAQVYQQYSPPPPPTSTLIQNFGAVTTNVTTITGGGGGQATGPSVTFTSNWNGVNFVASQNTLTLEITNAANARTALGAAASGINNDISQLNGASQVDVSGVYKVAGLQVLTSRQPAIPDSNGTQVDDTRAINAALAMLRIMGMIAP